MLIVTENLDPIFSGIDDADLEELVLRYCCSDDSVYALIKAYKLECEPDELFFQSTSSRWSYLGVKDG